MNVANKPERFSERGRLFAIIGGEEFGIIISVDNRVSVFQKELMQGNAIWRMIESAAWNGESLVIKQRLKDRARPWELIHDAVLMAINNIEKCN